jgi:FkbM family methyltransferase
MRQKTVSINFLETPLEVSLDLNKYTHKAIYQYATQGDVYEKETVYVMSKLINRGDVVVDVGAHIGILTMFLSVLVGDSGKVFSFEPETGNFSLLFENITKNSMNNIECFNLALGNKIGKSKLYINSDNDGGHALWDVGKHPFNNISRKNPKTVDIQVSTLDHVFELLNINTPRLLKIDAEGLEFEILKGGKKKVLEAGVPFIIAEMNIFGLELMGVDELGFRNFMSAYGYNTYAIMPGSRCLSALPHQESVFNRDSVVNILFAQPDEMERVQSH